MFKEKLIKYFRSKLTSITYNYALALGMNDEDGVHDLRVDLKKLKAFFNIIESLNESFVAKKQFKRFRRIAKSTSMIRDSQVQQHLLKKATGVIDVESDDYLDYLKENENKGVELFQQFSKEKHLLELHKSEIAIAHSIESLSDIIAITKAEGMFYNLRNDMLMLSSEEDLRDELLHEVRILSKETHYVFEIVNTCFGLFEDEYKTFTTAIKKVHHVLGIWHDYDVALHLFNTYLGTNSFGTVDGPHKVLADYYKKERDQFNGEFRSVFDKFKETAITI